MDGHGLRVTSEALPAPPTLDVEDHCFRVIDGLKGSSARNQERQVAWDLDHLCLFCLGCNAELLISYLEDGALLPNYFSHS